MELTGGSLGGTAEDPAATPVIDLRRPIEETAPELDTACRHHGFFQVVGHGVDPDLCDSLLDLSTQFFDLDDDEKDRVAMRHAGPAWRGWFPLGDELTSGRPDDKEGLYLGQDLGSDHPRVATGTPLHGANLWPVRPSALKPVALAYMDAVTAVGQRLLEVMGVALGLGRGWFHGELTSDPVVLFRIFHYPPATGGRQGWGVGEHTDYGLLTVLLQDGQGGLEVKGPDGWRPVEPLRGAFVCNLGDMLERITGGRYRSTPHRVANRSETDRYSAALFLDPGWEARIPGLEGTYGDYLSAKVSRVFPALFERITQPPG